MNIAKTHCFHKRFSHFRVIAILLIASSVYGIGSGEAGEKDRTHFVVDMTDFQFTPSMTWHVGDTVTLTVRNASDQGVMHEFMVGG